MQPNWGKADVGTKKMELDPAILAVSVVGVLVKGAKEASSLGSTICILRSFVLQCSSRYSNPSRKCGSLLCELRKQLSSGRTWLFKTMYFTSFHEENF